MDSVLHIGIDDTDSTKQGCTTYIGALLIEQLSAQQAAFLDYPHLIRLNPNVPWKTRGNGAICLRVKIAAAQRERVVEEAVQAVEAHADLKAAGTEPGLVVYAGQNVPSAFTAFARRAVTSVVRRDEAMRLIHRFHCKAVAWKGGRGIIGAIAAIGEPLKGDHTYELIAYRTPPNRGTARRVDKASVWEMNRKMGGLTFNNVDEAKGRVLITPRGPDPVLLGIRGETAEAVKTAFAIVKIQEAVERWVVFRTNQGTDAHLCTPCTISHVRPNRAVIVTGSISREPRTIPGRHVIFAISDNSGQIDCAAYEPTGKFRNNVRRLMLGDVVETQGGVRPPSNETPTTINLEKMRVLKLATKTITRNPLCPSCGKRMASMGRGQGMRCKKCGQRSRDAVKLVLPTPRALSEGLYLPPPRAHRHLTKPKVRYGREKTEEPLLPPQQFWSLGRDVTLLP